MQRTVGEDQNSTTIHFQYLHSTHRFEVVSKHSLHTWAAGTPAVSMTGDTRPCGYPRLQQGPCRDYLVREGFASLDADQLKLFMEESGLGSPTPPKST